MLFIVLFSIIGTIGGAALPDDVITKCLGDTNYFRELHDSTDNVEWDVSLAAGAQTWAENLISQGSMAHDDERGPVGENIFWMKSSRAAVCADAVLKWYKERNNYNYLTGSSNNGGDTGHFTQLVWKGTKKIGFGIASKTVADEVETYIVGRYSPAGNVRNFGNVQTQYVANVAGLKFPDETAYPMFHELPSGFCRDISPYCLYFKDNDYCHTMLSAMLKSCYQTCIGCNE